MIEKISTISIKGRCFHDETLLSFFKKANQRITIVYGKNGAGKSTVSEGVRALNAAVPGDISVSFLDSTNQLIPAADLAKKIFVFNEHYIDENVKIDDDGLGTIVLFGGQVDLQSEIDKYDDLTKKASQNSKQPKISITSFCKRQIQ